MRTGRTRGALVARLERLESRAAALLPVKVRFGNLRPLRPEYKGERHVVIAKHLPDKAGQEWVEFEEVPGPDPSPPRDHKLGVPDYIDIVAPLPNAAFGPAIEIDVPHGADVGHNTGQFSVVKFVRWVASTVDAVERTIQTR